MAYYIGYEAKNGLEDSAIYGLGGQSVATKIHHFGE
jgi:hypothetical protein